MTDPFARMHDRLHARLGAQDSTIRGVAATRPIVIEFGVGVTGNYGEVVTSRDVAVIAAADNPRPGDQIVVNGATFRIDCELDRNGYDIRCVLV